MIPTTRDIIQENVIMDFPILHRLSIGLRSCTRTRRHRAELPAVSAAPMLLATQDHGRSSTPEHEGHATPARAARHPSHPRGSLCAGRVLAVGGYLALMAHPALAIDPEPNPEPNYCVEDATGSLTIAPGSVFLGETATLQWSVQLPAACPASVRLISAREGERTVPRVGQRTVVAQWSPGDNWVLEATYAGYTQRLGAVSLIATPYPLPSGRDVLIDGNTLGHADLLKRALEVGGKNVILAPHVDIDMTGQTVWIGENTTLTSSSPRSASSLGPRIYVTDRPKPWLLIRCIINPVVNVKIHGIRLQGPHWGTASGDDNLERGIMIDSCRNVEISNNEISGWSGQGIYVQDPLRFINNRLDVQVRRNFFHHNQHRGGNGYGVESTLGGDVLIEENLFDYNRHAIAAGGGWDPGSRYTARHNLVLKGGGFHDWYPIYGMWFTHQFDVHGTMDCGPLIFDAPMSCGLAGEFFEYTANTIQYTRGAAIKVRGNPRYSPMASRNVFAAGESAAIKQNGFEYEGYITKPITKWNNRFSSDGYGRYGVCDFDGDGMDDLFQATGATWWYSSGGRFPWTFLRAATERLNEVGLGDFDGDGRCDVLAGNPFQLSRGGVEPWAPLPGSYGAPMAELRFGQFDADPKADVFRRDPEGQWWILSPGVHGWEPIQSSGIALKDLRFGHFDDDRILDVIGVVGGTWNISSGGRTPWTKLNTTLGASLSNRIVIGDIDGNGIDDIVNYGLAKTGQKDANQNSFYKVSVRMSKDGTGNWTSLASMILSPGDIEDHCGFDSCGWAFPTPLTGNFQGDQNGAQLWIADRSRNGWLLNPASQRFERHGLYPY